MRYKLLFSLGIILLPFSFANAAAFESSAGAVGDSWTSSTYSVGQTFTAISDHTVTSVDLDMGGSGNVILHFTTESGDLPATNLVSSASTAVSAGTVTFSLDCVALSNGVKYGFWIDNQSGTNSVISGVVSTYAGGTLSRREPSATNLVPNTTKTADSNFVIYGTTGDCTPPVPPVTFGSTTVASTTLQLVGTTAVGLGIIITILMVYLIAYLYNSMFKRKPWLSS